jgi:hypothetical protein
MAGKIPKCSPFLQFYLFILYFFKAFIFKRGKVPPPIKDLIQDMREVMYPYTAIKFQVNFFVFFFFFPKKKEGLF